MFAYSRGRTKLLDYVAQAGQAVDLLVCAEEQAMPEGDVQKPTTAPDPESLGFRALAMNEIAAPKTQEVSEVGRRAGSRWLVLVGVLVAAAAVYLIGRTLANLPPGAEAEARLRGRLTALDPWQRGVIRSAHYLSGASLRLDFSTQLSTLKEEDRRELRQATLGVMDVLMKERPNRDLRILGFQGEEQVVQAQYRQKSSLAGPGGQTVPDLSVRVRDDPEGLGGQVGGPGPE